MAYSGGKSSSTRKLKAKLECYWDKLLQRANENKRHEIRYFLHVTSKYERKCIERTRRLEGDSTIYPSPAPLAKCLDLKGVWFQLCGLYLSSVSPFGTQQLRISPIKVVEYLTTEHVKPLLFFETAYYFGFGQGCPQNVRFVLIRASDPQVELCRKMLKEIHISHNPFFFMSKDGRFYSYRNCPRSRGLLFVHVLVVGDLALDQVSDDPDWAIVRTVTSTTDTIMGVSVR